jgi:hypothetical protein
MHFPEILAGGNHRERETNKIRELEKVNDVCLVICSSDVSELCVFRTELGGGWCRPWPPNTRGKKKKIKGKKIGDFFFFLPIGP